MKGLDYDPAAALRRLRRDPEMRDWIRHAGPFALVPRRPAAPFPALLRAIVYQQLSGKAAATIHSRVLALFPGRGHPPPEALLDLDESLLRGAGLSRNKVLAVRDLAARVLDGTVPPLPGLRRMDDEEIVARLTTVRGIGRWTVEMLLIFTLGRPDVLPLNDLGVLRGFERVYGVDANAASLAEKGEAWRPYRSVASWYLWRAADMAAADLPR
ncbi:MAG TPA: DNA-3-methyladenine glycosylase 2 family protein [Gammaproteobacteria bacterium]